MAQPGLNLRPCDSACGNSAAVQALWVVARVRAARTGVEVAGLAGGDVERAGQGVQKSLDHGEVLCCWGGSAARKRLRSTSSTLPRPRAPTAGPPALIPPAVGVRRDHRHRAT